MGLPANEAYGKYADLERPYVVWNVFAAPEFALEEKEWRYPIVGSLAYRGYFKEADALAFAQELEKTMDVWVGGVPAYSTLGWFHDPVLNTFIDDSDLDLVGLICHELAHRLLFVNGDTKFSEAFAMTVEREAQRRWQKRYPPSLAEKGRKRIRSLERRRLLRARLEETETDLEKLYKESSRNTAEEIAELRREKEKLFQDLQEQIRQWFAQWGLRKDHPWVEKKLSNAFFTSRKTYWDLVPAFEKLLQDKNYDLDQFYQSVESLSKISKESSRHAALTKNL